MLFETLLALPVNFLKSIADTANRSLTLVEIEMLRYLDLEFRGNDCLTCRIHV